MLFPSHLQARELYPQTYSLSLPLEWSQVTHIPTSIKSGGAYKPKKSAFYNKYTFARQPCDDTHLPGWLYMPFQHTHKHSSPLQQALHIQIANRHIQWAGMNTFLVFFVFVVYFFFEHNRMWKEKGNWDAGSNCIRSVWYQKVVVNRSIFLTMYPP